MLADVRDLRGVRLEPFQRYNRTADRGSAGNDEGIGIASASDELLFLDVGLEVAHPVNLATKAASSASRTVKSLALAFAHSVSAPGTRLAARERPRGSM